MSKADKPKITATENGPYIVTGVTSLQTSRGESAKTVKTMVLCRCGKTFARLTGHENVHGLCTKDLMTANSEISMYTDIEHV